MFESCCMVDRNPNQVPQVDFYVAGAPCPAFSQIGRRQGLKDNGGAGGANRGAVLLDCVGYIVSRRPKTFILEQVPGLLQGKHKKVFDKIMVLLQGVERRGKPLYHVEFKVVNTCELTGIPQNRPRVYILGAYKTLMQRHGVTEFTWPHQALWTNMLLNMCTCACHADCGQHHISQSCNELHNSFAATPKQSNPKES